MTTTTPIVHYLPGTYGPGSVLLVENFSGDTFRVSEEMAATCVMFPYFDYNLSPVQAVLEGVLS